MNVTIKDFNVAMGIKNKGIELQIKDNNDQHLGDLVLTKRHVIWCKGRTTRLNGKRLTWARFAEMMREL